MIKKLEIKPEEFECVLGEMPAGMFIHYAGDLALIGTKTNYPAPNDDQRKLVVGEDGLEFWAGTSGYNERDVLKVIPILTKWV